MALRQAPRFSCDNFILQGTLYAEKGCLPRVGYTVTKKIGNSVERNRIRRRLRQAIATAFNCKMAENADDEPHGGYCGEMVVVARRGALDDTYADLVSKFTKGIDRLVTKGNKAA